MSIEAHLSDLTAAIAENTAVLREVLAAGGAPTNVVAITETPKPAPKGKAKAAAPALEPEPTPEPATERPTKVAAPAASEAPDPLDPDTKVVVQGTEPVKTDAVDPEAVIKRITDTWKSMLTAADDERKTMLKDKFPELRAKWGLAADAKLISLAPTPEKLVGLLEDIKAL